MNCPKCNTEMRKYSSDFHFPECGLNFVYLSVWPALICLRCEFTLPLLRDTERMTDAILEQLVFPRRTILGDEARFIREALRMNTSDMAARLKLTEGELLKRERRSVVPSPFSERLKDLVRERLIQNRRFSISMPVFGTSTNAPRGQIRGKILLYC